MYYYTKVGKFGSTDLPGTRVYSLFSVFLQLLAVYVPFKINTEVVVYNYLRVCDVISRGRTSEWLNQSTHQRAPLRSYVVPPL